MDKLNVGVIGAGKMGLLHAGIFNSLEQSTLAGVADTDGFIINILKSYFPSVGLFGKYNEMLEKVNPDIIVITTPVFLHKQIIEDTMKQDAAIFVEKPLVTRGSECRSLLNRNYRNPTLVGYCRRFMETYNLAKKIIENGFLGKVNYFNSHLFVAQIFKQGKGWLYNPEMSGGGVLVDLGSHAIDLLHYLFGDIQSVNAFAKPVFNKDVEDYVCSNLLFRNGIFGSLQVSWSVRNYRLPELKIQIQLDSGSINVTEKYINIYSEIDRDFIKKGWNNFYKQDLKRNVSLNIAGPEYTLEDSHLVNCIMDHKSTLCDFREAAKTNFVIDHIYSSIAQGSVEKVSYEG